MSRVPCYLGEEKIVISYGPRLNYSKSIDGQDLNIDLAAVKYPGECEFVAPVIGGVFSIPCAQLTVSAFTNEKFHRELLLERAERIRTLLTVITKSLAVVSRENWREKKKKEREKKRKKTNYTTTTLILHGPIIKTV